MNTPTALRALLAALPAPKIAAALEATITTPTTSEPRALIVIEQTTTTPHRSRRQLHNTIAARVCVGADSRPSRAATA